MTEDEKTRLSTSFTEAHVGTQLSGIYELDERLASGGMGEVFRGHNIQTGDHVAIKIVLPEFARDQTILSLFRKEASILNHLSHDAVVRYHVFTIDPGIGRPYLAMEFVDGQSLFDVMRRGGLATAEVRKLCHRLSAGLYAVHQAGAIHRDLSPDNIILPGGRVDRAKIIDFGIARSGNIGGETLIGGRFAGKYNYVSPEQLGLYGGDVTEQSDMYSLGLVLAAVLLGKPIEMAGSQYEIVEKRRSVPDLSGIDADFRPIIEAMLQPDPKDRPASMAEIARATRDADDLDGTMPPNSSLARERKSAWAPTEAPATTGWASDTVGGTRATDSGFVPHTRPAHLSAPRPMSAGAAPPPPPVVGKKGSGGKAMAAAGVAALLLAGGAGAWFAGLIPLPGAASNDVVETAPLTPDLSKKPEPPVTVAVAPPAEAMKPLAETKPVETPPVAKPPPVAVQEAETPPVATPVEPDLSAAEIIEALMQPKPPTGDKVVVPEQKAIEPAAPEIVAKPPVAPAPVVVQSQPADKPEQTAAETIAPATSVKQVEAEPAEPATRPVASSPTVKDIMDAVPEVKTSEIADSSSPVSQAPIAGVEEPATVAVAEPAAPVATAREPEPSVPPFDEPEPVAAAEVNTAPVTPVERVEPDLEPTAQPVAEPPVQPIAEPEPQVAEPQAPEPPPVTADDTQLAFNVPKPDVPPPGPIDGVAARVSWLRDYAGGDCFYATALSATDKAIDIEGFATAVDPFSQLLDAFQAKFSVEPDISVRLIAPTQCEVTRFLTALNATREEKPRLTLDRTSVSNGTPISGSLQTRGGLRSSLLLVDHKGMVFNLDDRVSIENGKAVFSIPIGLGASDKAAAKAVPQLIIAVTGNSDLKSAEIFTPTPAAVALPKILAEIRSKGSDFTATAKYFRLGG